jgi:PAS domain S-box-containing protein
MPATAPLSFSILDSSPIGHFILDGALTIRFWNRCLEEWTGLSRQDVVGSPLAERFPHLARPKYLNRIEPILRGGPPTTFSSQLHKHLLPAPLPGGRLRIQHTVVSPLATDTAGSFDALFSIEDVTSLTDTIDQHSATLTQLTEEALLRQQAEAALREIDRLKNVFIASAAHELNTPLTTITGYAEMLRDKGHLLDDTRKIDYANEIYESAECLSKIIHDLLDLARFEEGYSLRLEKAPFDPNVLILKAVRHLMDRHPGHAFVVELAEGRGRTVTVDAIRIRQVLENILGNAVKYSTQGTTITVTSTWKETGIVIRIIDQGIGMTEEEAARMFDKFYRADGAGTSSRGLGLGMCIVKQIVAEHRGTISVASSHGQGTTITLFLPQGRDA